MMNDPILMGILITAGIILLCTILFLLFGNRSKKTPTESKENTRPLSEHTTKTGLKIEILKEGQGKEAIHGSTVSVHYTGTLQDGSVFDSSRNHGAPFSFKLGFGKVIDGWDQGIKGMKKGELRRLTVPADLGYGAKGHGNRIPPNAILIFEVEMIAIK